MLSLNIESMDILMIRKLYRNVFLSLIKKEAIN